MNEPQYSIVTIPRDATVSWSFAAVPREDVELLATGIHADVLGYRPVPQVAFEGRTLQFLDGFPQYSGECWEADAMDMDTGEIVRLRQVPDEIMRGGE